MTEVQQKKMAERIKRRREALGYTQESFCEAINLSASSYTKIENAFQKPALDTLIKIAKLLDLPLDYIVFGTDEDEVKEVSDADFLHAMLKEADSEKLLYASKFLARLAKTIEKK